MVLMWETIKEAFSRGMAIYDFLHGTEEYKFKWTQTVKRTQSLLVYPRGRVSPRLYFWLRTLKQRFQVQAGEQQPEFAN
jgi:CelD/BcsL family acetyltransferase involved in cellulose biosynthesis